MSHRFISQKIVFTYGLCHRQVVTVVDSSVKVLNRRQKQQRVHPLISTKLAEEWSMHEDEEVYWEIDNDDQQSTWCNSIERTDLKREQFFIWYHRRNKHEMDDDERRSDFVFLFSLDTFLTNENKSSIINVINDTSRRDYNQSGSFHILFSSLQTFSDVIWIWSECIYVPNMDSLFKWSKSSNKSRK